MIDMKTAMLSALKNLPACTAESFRREELSLPLITVEDAQRSVLARVDGRPYLEKYQARVDVYAATPEERDLLFLQADAALSNLGLVRESTSADHDDTAYACHQTILYKAVLCGEWLYQEG
jgi:hypothetical protein